MTQETINTKSIKLPNLMKYLLIYLYITVFLCFFGPIHFNIRNPLLLLFYISAYHLALWVGYKAACKSDIRKYPVLAPPSFSRKDKIVLKRVIIIGLIFDVLLLVLVCGTVNPTGILEKVMEGIKSPSTRYDNAFIEGSARGSSIASLMVTFGMPITIMALILSIYFYSNLSRGYKFCTIILYLTHLCYCLTQGANEGVFDIAIYIGVALYLRLQNQNVNRQRLHIKKKKKIMLIIAVGILMYIAFSFFTENIIGRTQANFAFGTLGENYYDKNAAINKYIPAGLYITFVYLTAYLCEGYYGMSLATTLEWVPNWGMGFSPFIRNNLSDILGVDLFANSYQVRIDEVYDWGALRNFHTAYTFWANDVGYIGVIFIMFILGYVFGKCYRASILRQSKSAIIMMPLLVTMIFYLPANNKIFVQPASMLLMVYLAGYEFLKYFSIRKNRVI